MNYTFTAVTHSTSYCDIKKVQTNSIKYGNGMDLTDAEDIKKRWQEYTEELYKKDLMTQIITMV